MINKIKKIFRDLNKNLINKTITRQSNRMKTLLLLCILTLSVYAYAEKDVITTPFIYSYGECSLGNGNSLLIYASNDGESKWIAQ